MLKTILNFDPELTKLLRLIKQHSPSTPKNTKILDVGCGYGRVLKPLLQAGFNIIGTDKNQQIINHNRANNLPCVEVDKLMNDKSNNFDAIIMSHFVEHFTPLDLFNVMQEYLALLKPGGKLYIATPLYTNYFYDDFDHVKPYHPTGIMMAFNKNPAQIQYQAKQHLKLVDLWYRRSAFVLSHHRGVFINGFKYKLNQLFFMASKFIFYISGGKIGKKDAWLGVFEKV